MALGINNGKSKHYLSVGFGKFRQKSLDNKERVTRDTLGSKMRQTQQGGESWAIEYDWIEGIIEAITYKEDPQYGNSFEILIVDGPERYQLSFGDDTRFWFDLAKKLPNIDINAEVKLNPYDFTDKTGARRVGLSVEQNSKKIESFYSKKEGNEYKMLYGFPIPDAGMNWKDRDETKIYTIRVKKFLKNEIETRVQPMFNNSGKSIPEDHIDEFQIGIGDDLPF